MKFDKFSIHATPHFSDAYCTCGSSLTEVDNGWTSSAMFCPKCEKVFIVKLSEYKPKKSRESQKEYRDYVEQCRRELEFRSKSVDLRKEIMSRGKKK